LQKAAIIRPSIQPNENAEHFTNRILDNSSGSTLIVEMPREQNNISSAVEEHRKEEEDLS
jgi:hypothetical protein